LKTGEIINNPIYKGKHLCDLLFEDIVDQDNTNNHVEDADKKLDDFVCVNETVSNVYQLHPKFLEFITVLTGVFVVNQINSPDKIEEINQTIEELTQQNDMVKLQDYFEKTFDEFFNSDSDKTSINNSVVNYNSSVANVDIQT
jgi:hypothetical protein